MRATFIQADVNEGSFSRLIWLRTQEFYRAFAELGVTLQVVDQTRLVAEPREALRDVERFRPDFVTATNFNYLLLSARNDPGILHLDVPTVALWDDPLGALANALSYDPSQWECGSGPGWPAALGAAWGRLRDRLRGRARLPAPGKFLELTRNPRLIHFAWDSGHAEAFASLGLARPEEIRWHPVATYDPFLNQPAVEPTTDVAFCGNLYLHAVHQSRFWQDPFFRGLTERLTARKVADLAASNWQLLLDEVGRVPTALRRLHGLFTDRREFWEYYRFGIWSALNTLVRLEVLRGLRHDVSLFGLFSDPATRGLLGAYPNLKFVADLEHFEELPRQFAATRVNVCLCNSLIYQGTASKLMDCLGSGGFALCDPKHDLVRLFGRTAEAIFFRNAEELNARVEHFLARPGERAEIAAELRRVVRERCTLRSLFTEVLRAVRPAGRAAA
jgi:hypothetical protein